MYSTKKNSGGWEFKKSHTPKKKQTTMRKTVASRISLETSGRSNGHGWKGEMFGVPYRLHLLIMNENLRAQHHHPPFKTREYSSL